MSTEPESAPLVIIVSGPSGSGKSTLVQRILELPGTMPSVSCTTRPRRAAQVKQKLPESVAIFILPPSREELERRLRSRGQDSDEEIARRLAKARDEILAFSKYYDYCVVNDDVERAGKEAQAIVIALHCQAARRRGRVEKLLASFGGK